MKLKTNTDPQAFLDGHVYVEHLLIHYQDETLSFSSADNKIESNSVLTEFGEVIDFMTQKSVISADPSAGEDISDGDRFGGYFFALREGGGIVYIVYNNGIVFVFQCSNDASVAQVKMETEAFISGCQIKGKYKGLFSSIFKR